VSVQTEEEIKRIVISLRMDKAFSYREIAKETGLSLAKISEILKGVPKPLGKFSKEDLPKDTQPSQPVPSVISREYVGKLYWLAMGEGFDDVNKWIAEVMLPWYAVKRDFEWKLRMKLNPAEFSAFIQTAMTDSIELKQLKARLRDMGSPLAGKAETVQPTVSPMPSVTTSVQPNKGEVKP